MTYVLLYIAVLIAAMVGVGVIVARLPRANAGTKNDQDDDIYSYSNGPQGYGFYFQGFRLNHGAFDDDEK